VFDSRSYPGLMIEQSPDERVSSHTNPLLRASNERTRRSTPISFSHSGHDDADFSRRIATPDLHPRPSDSASKPSILRDIRSEWRDGRRFSRRPAVRLAPRSPAAICTTGEPLSGLAAINALAKIAMATGACPLEVSRAPAAKEPRSSCQD
jgi:hypothetical protein